MMAKDSNFIKPGAMKQKGYEYLNRRKKKIDRNNMRVTALGLKAMADSLFGSNKKGNDKIYRERGNMDLDADDEEYQPLDGEGNLSSFDDAETTCRASRKRVRAISPPRSTPRTRTVASIESTMAPTPTSTQELPVEQDSLSTTQGSLPKQMVKASTSTRVRGATRGINTERLIAASNAKKLVVEVPLEVGAPVGENATRFATWLGVQIRMAAPLKDMEKWDDIPPAFKAPILQAAREIVKNKKKARASLPFDHTMGSKSFAAAMSAQTKDRGGQRPPIADFYKSTHYNENKKKWAAPICQQLHVQLEARHKEDEARRQEVEALGSPVTMPQKEMPIEVLGKKFYLKEYGVGLKPSSSKRSSGQSYEEVRVLTNEVETLKDVCQEQKNQIQTLTDLCQTQQEKIQAYDEKFARFETVLSAYVQGGLIGPGLNPQ